MILFDWTFYRFVLFTNQFWMIVHRNTPTIYLSFLMYSINLSNWLTCFLSEYKYFKLSLKLIGQLENFHRKETTSFCCRKVFFVVVNNPDRQNLKNNAEIRVKVLTKKETWKAHIFKILSPFVVYDDIRLKDLRVSTAWKSTRSYYSRFYPFLQLEQQLILTTENVHFSRFYLRKTFYGE